MSFRSVVAFVPYHADVCAAPQSRVLGAGYFVKGHLIHFRRSRILGVHIAQLKWLDWGTLQSSTL